MSRLVYISATAAALALAACSPEADTPAAETGETTAPAASPSAATPAATPASPAPVSSGTTLAAIPEVFRGVWDYEKGTCDVASDLRMEVGETSIRYYESQGQVTKVVSEGAQGAVVTLAMQGEGEKWTNVERFSLNEDGSRLLVTDVEDTSGQTMPRKRCPA